MPPAAHVDAPPPWRRVRASGAVIIAIAIVAVTDTTAALLHFSGSPAADAIAALVIFAAAWLSLGDAARSPARAAAVGCVFSLLALGYLGLGVAMVMEGGGGLVAAAVLVLSLGLTAACAAFVRWLRVAGTSTAEGAADRIRVALSAALCALGVPWLLARSSSEDLGAVAPALVVAGGMSIALAKLTVPTMPVSSRGSAMSSGSRSARRALAPPSGRGPRPGAGRATAPRCTRLAL